MLGYWNKSVYITYLGALCAIIGYFFSLKFNNPSLAFVGMFLAAVCDMFDGKVARLEKGRSEQAKSFGVEIDSLADVICFIVIPALTIYHIGLNEWYEMTILSLYCVCGIVRLAYFNVAMSDKNKAIKEYTGLPVTSSALIFPFVYIFKNLLGKYFVLLYGVCLLVVGILFVSKIKIKKPRTKTMILFIIVGVLEILLIITVKRLL